MPPSVATTPPTRGRQTRTRPHHTPLETSASFQISEFFDEAKGDALNAMEMSLAMEKLNFIKLRWTEYSCGVELSSQGYKGSRIAVCCRTY